MVAISDVWIEDYADTTYTAWGMTKNGESYEHSTNLEWTIVHEIDHAMEYNDKNHVNGDPWLTPNVKKCSGLN